MKNGNPGAPPVWESSFEMVKSLTEKIINFTVEQMAEGRNVLIEGGIQPDTHTMILILRGATEEEMEAAHRAAEREGGVEIRRFED